MKLFKNEIEYLLKELTKLTKGRDNLNMILSNKTTSYNKASICYELNSNAKSLMSICYVEKKTNCYVYKCDYYCRIGHFELYFFNKMEDLKWSNRFKSNKNI